MSRAICQCHPIRDRLSGATIIYFMALW